MKTQATTLAIAAALVIALGLYIGAGKTSQNDTDQGFTTILTGANLSEPKKDVRTTFQPFAAKALKTEDNLTEFLLDRPALEQLYQDQPQRISLKIPTPSGGLTDVPMEKTELLPADFKVTLNENEEVAVDRGVHYQYVGSKDSIAAISIFANAMNGLIATQEGNFSISPNREAGLGDHYALQFDDPLTGIDCGTTTPAGYGEKVQEVLAKAENNKNTQSRAADPVVKVYVEMENELFRTINSVQNAQQYIISLFNVSSLIFASDSMKVQLSEARIWTDADPYPSALSRGDRLREFTKIGLNYNGNMAALLGPEGSGGLAYISDPCNAWNFSYSSVPRTVATYPQWSRSVYVLTHELGHNLGSVHTHQCAWGPNGDQVIDYCAPSVGQCGSTQPNPGAGGSIMSYCSNFSLANGFGPEPAALLRAIINQSACLREQTEYVTCPLDSILLNTRCIFNTTPTDPTDDLFQVGMKIVSTATSGTWTATVDGQTNTYPYNQQVTLPSLNAWQKDYEVIITDDISGCSTTRRISTPLSCYSGDQCTPTIFSQNYGGVDSEFAKSIIPLANGDAIVVGHTNLNRYGSFQNSHMQARRIDEQGNLVWMIGSSILGNGIIEDLTQLSDGNLLAVGQAPVDANGVTQNSVITLIKFTPSGTLIWRKQMIGTGNENDNLFAVTSLPNGGFIAAGQTGSGDLLNSPIFGRRDALVLEFDTDGNVVWAKNYGGAPDDYFIDIAKLSTGGYVLLGGLGQSVNSNSKDNWILKIASDGSEQWNVTKGRLANSQSGAITETTDGQIVVGSSSDDINDGLFNRLSPSNNWVIKLDQSDGSTLWRTNLLNSQNRPFNDILPLPNGDIYAILQEGVFDTQITSQNYFGNITQVSSAGKVTWRKLMGGNNQSGFETAALRRDGKLILSGWSLASNGDLPGNNGVVDAWVVMLQPDQCVVQPPVCVISPSISGITCNDSGTPNDRYDDTYNAELTVQSSGPCNASFSYSGSTFPYDSVITIGPFLISDGDQTITVTDPSDTTSAKTLIAVAPEYCSANDFDFIDLELTTDVAGLDPDEFTVFTINYIISNKGNQNDSSIQVVLRFPQDLVYPSGNEYSLTAGEYDPYLPTGIWRIESLAAGESETLTINLYNLSNDERFIYGELQNQDGPDFDSFHRNGTPPIVNEDDEAVIILNGPPVCTISATSTTSVCDDNSTPSDPSDDTFTSLVTVTNTNACSGQWTDGGQSASYDSTTTFGPYPISAGSQTIVFEDSSDSTITSTITLIPPATCSNLMCTVTAQESNKTCDDNGTPSDPSDDLFSFDVTILSDGPCGSTWSTEDTTGNYGEVISFGPFAISGGTQTLLFSDVLDTSATALLVVDAPAPCSVGPCAINAAASNLQCADNSTPNDPTDDTFTFDVVVTSSAACGTTWSDGTTTGTYNQTSTFGPFLITDGTQTITFLDTSYTAATTSIGVLAPLPCSTPQGIIDLELSANATAQTPSAYTFVSTTFTVTNNGTQAEQGITVQIPQPAGFVLEGGNEFSLTQGDFSTNNQTWTVGALGAGAQASITLNFFTLTTDEVIVYGQVLAQASTDLDSNPNNGVSPIPVEDDEAAVIFNGSASPPCAIQTAVSNITCDDQGTPNNLSDDQWSFDLLVTSNNNCGADWTSTLTNGSYNTAQSFGPFDIANGNVNLTVSDLIDPSTNTIVVVTAPAPCSMPIICSIAAQTSNITCDDLGTPYDPSDDQWSFDLLVTSTNSCGTDWTTSLTNGSYGTVQTFGPFDIANGDINLEIYDLVDSTASITLVASAPAPCSVPQVCSITAQVSNINCDNNGTAGDASDDLYSFDLMVNSSAYCSSGWLEGSTGGNYGQAKTFGPYPIAGGDQSIIIIDSLDALITTTVQVVAPQPCSIPSQIVDLELSANATGSTPSAYSFVSTTFTISNIGTQDEQDILIQIPTPSGFVLEGGNEYSVTQGSFSTSNQQWAIDDLAVGKQESITLNYFTLTQDEVAVYGQVLAQASIDLDSNPNNGVSPVPVEDDEAVITFNSTGPPPCGIQGSISSTSCDDLGTPNDPSDDQWSFDLLVTSNGNCGTDWTSSLVGGVYETSQTFGPFDISAGDINLVIQDVTNPSVSISVLAMAPLPCSISTTCIISATTSNVSCDDAGTPLDPSDDQWSFDLTVNSNTNCGTDWTSVVGVGTYGTSQSFGPFDISGGDINLVIQDMDDTTVSINVTADAPQTCSGRSQGVDLELDLIVDNPNPGEWTNVPMHLTLSNTGTDVASDIRVDFLDQSNSAVSGLLAYVTSAAPSNTSFNAWQGIWLTPSLAPGESVTLDYTGYSKSLGQINLFGEVILQGQTDQDSSPNNGNGISAQEDDEASFVLNTQLTLSAAPTGEDLRLYPNPADEYVIIELGPWAKIRAELELRNTLGTLIYKREWDTLWNEEVELNITDLPSGYYMILVRKPGSTTYTLPFVKVE